MHQFKFSVIKTSKKSGARLGELKTPHGIIQTPAFIPVATLGIIKGGLDFEETAKLPIQCEITNTFHFLDLDQTALVKKAGGLHSFFHFQKPIFTDSGGFQVFSLGKGTEYGLGKIHSLSPLPHEKITKRKEGLVKITEEGATFFSPRDGRKILLTPELSAQTQIDLGADFMYLLDICGSIVDSKVQTKNDFLRTMRWYDRFIRFTQKTRQTSDQAIFGIIQGGLHKDLREVSTHAVNDLPVFGTAIGGAFIKKDLFKILSWIQKITDPKRPHHMLGVGDIASIPEMIKRGIDLFDCALPTRIARHGSAFTKNGVVHIRQTQFRKRFSSLEKTCNCITCTKYTLAELHFFARGKEMLLGKLLTIHNITFLEKELAEIRKKI